MLKFGKLVFTKSIKLVVDDFALKAILLLMKLSEMESSWNCHKMHPNDLACLDSWNPLGRKVFCKHPDTITIFPIF